MNFWDNFFERLPYIVISIVATGTFILLIIAGIAKIYDNLEQAQQINDLLKDNYRLSIQLEECKNGK
ncbi:MAG: hypothetical protein LBC06_01090 [Rickettsiales bacterium]|jgi:hypothetical protein|nr:hypothetical protein [Rickettsiales bacterium]